ncbi:stage II sporulation protein D [Fredinandcohnia quinoae]|uniref:Stage II sporulation protein D n=1 Tax=Fredinandcohnia quinoae TaxID=2918902 RepID=A0AAW5E1L2_9BACI|nr:stage II sporulation protein D [Fredinandcohnia sp. SECRCQ15]MCH1625160.1 stage II sporulation protein D [Fredinandcohnia sp. SECRCQ15]
MKPIKPFIVLVAILFVVILMIPTLLVIPFSEEKASGKLEEAPKSNPESLSVSTEPAVEVAVYRANMGNTVDIPLEEYVIGVLASEMPASFELEALKAQALAARTYVVRQMLSEQKVGVPKGTNADVTDTTSHQVYKSKEELKNEMKEDYDWKMEKLIKAVTETKGQILTYDGAPIDASFFSTSNGYTENSEDYWKNPYPYLKSVPSPWDKNSKEFHGQITMSVKDFEQRLGVKIGDSKEIGKIIERTSSNRVATVEIGGKTFSGKEIREKYLDLRSSDFSWERKGDHIIIDTKGYGHGVGMSQYGADGMAKEGKSYKDIVTYYYQGVQISSATDFLNKITAKK